MFAVVGLLVLLTGCGRSSDGSATSVPLATVAPEVNGAALSTLLDVAVDGRWRATGDDQFEVWICRVSPDTTNPLYGGLQLRLALTPEAVTEVLAAHVTPYFEELSHGQYRPVFVPGGVASLSGAAEPGVCVDHAMAGAGADTRAVLVVADAEHGADQIGGFGSGGVPCALPPPCPAAEAQRYVYVGASDFHPDWGDAPPMDLVQHEIGHTLGWDHSAVGEGRYESALDVMSNPAAPRELQPDRRDAQGTLAINLFAAGWLPEADVWMVPPEGGEVVLQPSAAAAGIRLAVLMGGDGALTVELLVPEGLNDHLPVAGIAVHRVSFEGGLATLSTPAFGEPPYTDLLQAGDSLVADGWLVEVGDDFAVTVTPHLG